MHSLNNIKSYVDGHNIIPRIVDGVDSVQQIEESTENGTSFPNVFFLTANGK